jgi:flavin-dependent dehydrogenase
VVGNFKLTNKDILYVVLYYAEYLKNDFNPRDLDGFFMQYKSWSAPSGNDHGAILGVGANYGYAYAEEIFNRDWKKNVPWPKYTAEKVEKGMTPYHTSVYSLVDDGFIALGDAACHTKPTCGEGCTSSLVAGEIAVEVISNLLKSDKYLTKERMWSINKRYMKAQGKDFDSMRPLLMGIVSLSPKEAEYLFKKDIIFSRKILGNQGEDLDLSAKDIADILSGIASGIATGKIKPTTVGAIAKGLLGMAEVTSLYGEYPDSPAGYFEWKEKADALWDKIGSMADKCDKEILRRLGY